MSPLLPAADLHFCTDPWFEWDDSMVRTVRTAPTGDRPATYSMRLSPGELPVATWRMDHGRHAPGMFEEHAHDFPGVAYFETGGGLDGGARSPASAQPDPAAGAV